MVSKENNINMEVGTYKLEQAKFSIYSLFLTNNTAKPTAVGGPSPPTPPCYLFLQLSNLKFMQFSFTALFILFIHLRLYSVYDFEVPNLSSILLNSGIFLLSCELAARIAVIYVI